MKTLKRISIAIMAMAMCISCSQQKQYTDVIPHDAAVVVSMNLMSLGEKASIKDYKGFIDMGLMQIQNQNPAIYDKLKAVCDDPAQSGLALNEPIYIFNLPEDNSGAVVMKVSDGNKIKDLIKSVAETGSLEYTEEGDNLWIATEAAIVVTNDLVLGGENRVILEKLLNRSTDTKITDTPLWDDLMDCKGDIKVATVLGNVPDTEELAQQPELQALYRAIGFDPKECTSVVALDFQDGKAVITGKSTVGEETEKLQKDLCNKIDGEFLNMLPANPALFIACNINGTALAEFLTKIVSTVPDAKDAAMAIPVLENIDGEISVTVNDMQRGSEIPDFTAYIKVKNDSWETMLAGVDNVPGLRHGMVDKNTFYITTNNSVAANPGKELSASVADSDWADEADGKYNYIVAEAAPIKAIASNFLSRREMRQADMVLNLFERMEIASSTIDEGCCILYFTDKETNALKQIIKLAVGMSMN